MYKHHLPFTLVDLTHSLTPSIPTWNGKCGFNHKINYDYDSCTTATKFRTYTLQMEAGIGTHMDAPSHCIRGGLSISDLSLEKLVSPCVVIDVSSRSREDYKITVQDIRDFEENYGRIQKRTFVMFHTGWGRFWNTPWHYRNNYIFPSISKDSALFLLDREITGIGIDTLSPDLPQDDFPVHHVLLNAEKYIVENITSLEKMPPTGAFSLALPLKIQHGTEAPIRLIGLVLN